MAIKLGCDKHAGLMVCGNGATVHDLNAAEPAKSLAERATLRADTLSKAVLGPSGARTTSGPPVQAW